PAVTDRLPPTLGLVLASIHTGASNGLWSEIARLAQRSGSSLFVFPGGRLECQEGHEYLRNSIYSLVNPDNVDGVITWASALTGSVGFTEVQNFLSTFSPLPLVSIGIKQGGCPVVSFDAYSGVQAVILHCITKHQGKRIAFIRGPENHYSAQDRYRAYCDTLDQTGLVFDAKLVSDPFPWTEGAKAMDQLLVERGLVPGQDFDTLACSSDMMMFDAGKQLQNAGYQIPRDVRIVGYNDSSESHLLRVPCTTARMPVNELARMSWTLLENLLDGQKASCFDILLPSVLVVRRSCGCVYSLGTEEQARAMVGTKQSYLTWLLQSFTVPEEYQEEVSQLLYTGNEPDFSLLERFSYQFLDRGGDPNLLSEALHWFELFHANERFLREYSASIRDLFLRQRDLVAHEHAYRLSLQAKRLDELKCDLLGVREVSAIPALLAKHLLTLGLEACFLVLYKDDRESMFLGGYSGSLIIGEQQRFAKHLLLPPSLKQQMECGVYVVESLFMDNQPLGYLVIGTSLFNGGVMEELRTSLSSALKGAFLLDAANRAREEAEKAQRARSEFFANVGEGLRTPLESILSLIQNSDPNVQAQVGEQIRSATHLLDLSLSHTGELELEMRTYHLDELFTDLVEANTLQYHGPSDLPTLLGDVMRLKNILESFADFDDATKPLSDQTLADFTSKYLDIHDKVKKHSSKEKVSILDDVDFEVSLIHRDEINVGYILRLLAGIQAMPPKEQQEQKKKIMDIVDSDVTLRSKRELIDNFIEKSLLHASHDEDITQVFEAYVEQEKGKALAALCSEERLDSIKLTGLLDNYLFTDVMPREDEVAETLTWT
ncbi:MAG: hypothetical protein EOM68_19090, partial [Spirochaetia bacterium]|nr:hypothetical protein [Spirochaetia bacterium]